MKIRTIFAIAASLMIAGCSVRPINVKLASEGQDTNNLKFFATDATQVGQSPKYSTIAVYDLQKDCVVPGCPIVWQVSVSETGSPIELFYGGLPSVGAITMVGARPLQPGHRYRLVVSQDHHSPQTSSGSVDFEVTADDKAITVGEPKKDE